jgi:hypothetical protein
MLDGRTERVVVDSEQHRVPCDLVEHGSSHELDDGRNDQCEQRPW